LDAESSSSDNIHYVPETAPFNFDENGALIKPMKFKANMDPASPIISKKSHSQSSDEKNMTMNDSMFYSPPVFHQNRVQKEKKESNDDDDFQSFPRRKLSNPAEKALTTKGRSKMKKLIPTKSSASPSEDDIIGEPLEIDEARPRQPVYLPDMPSPDLTLMKKRKRRGKGPEDWTCTECIRLFKESNIDTNKLKPSMNFCPEHRNRYTYYLGTPPDFWNPQIVGSPRKGRISSSQTCSQSNP